MRRKEFCVDSETLFCIAHFPPNGHRPLLVDGLGYAGDVAGPAPDRKRHAVLEPFLGVTLLLLQAGALGDGTGLGRVEKKFDLFLGFLGDLQLNDGEDPALEISTRLGDVSAREGGRSPPADETESAPQR